LVKKNLPKIEKEFFKAYKAGRYPFDGMVSICGDSESNGILRV